MKKLFCFLAVAATAAFTSCSSDDDSGNNGENPGTGNEVTAITLSASATSVDLGTAVTFNVVDQDGDAVANATLTANGGAITSPWTAETAGEYTVVATLGELTSSVTVTVNEVEVPQTPNTFSIGDDSYSTDTSLLVYLGTDADNVNYWVAAAYDSTNEETSTESDIYFTSNQTSETTLDFPAVGNFSFGETVPGTVDAYVVYNDNEIETEDAIASLDFNLASLNIPAAEGDAQNWAYTYVLTLNNGTVVEGNFSGDWSFLNASAGRNINTNNIIIKRSKAEIMEMIATKAYLK